MRGVNVVRPVRPGVGAQTLLGHKALQAGLGRGNGIRPGGDKRGVGHRIPSIPRDSIPPYGSTGYPASIQATKPPNRAETRGLPLCKRTNAARALVCSSSQVQ